MTQNNFEMNLICEFKVYSDNEPKINFQSKNKNESTVIINGNSRIKLLCYQKIIYKENGKYKTKADDGENPLEIKERQLKQGIDESIKDDFLIGEKYKKGTYYNEEGDIFKCPNDMFKNDKILENEPHEEINPETGLVRYIRFIDTIKENMTIKDFLKDDDKNKEENKKISNSNCNNNLNSNNKKKEEIEKRNNINSNYFDLKNNCNEKGKENNDNEIVIKMNEKIIENNQINLINNYRYIINNDSDENIENTNSSNDEINNRNDKHFGIIKLEKENKNNTNNIINPKNKNGINYIETIKDNNIKNNYKHDIDIILDNSSNENSDSQSNKVNKTNNNKNINNNKNKEKAKNRKSRKNNLNDMNKMNKKKIQNKFTNKKIEEIIDLNETNYNDFSIVIDEEPYKDDDNSNYYEISSDNSDNRYNLRRKSNQTYKSYSKYNSNGSAINSNKSYRQKKLEPNSLIILNFNENKKENNNKKKYQNKNHNKNINSNTKNSENDLIGKKRKNEKEMYIIIEDDNDSDTLNSQLIKNKGAKKNRY